MERHYEIATPWGRAACRLNILSGFLAFLDIIPALFALFMIFEPFGAMVSPSDGALLLLMAAFPAITVACIRASHSHIRAGREWKGFVVSLVPLVVAALFAVAVGIAAVL